jgi:hypothetical protein
MSSLTTNETTTTKKPANGFAGFQAKGQGKRALPHTIAMPPLMCSVWPVM